MDNNVEKILNQWKDLCKEQIFNNFTIPIIKNFEYNFISNEIIPMTPLTDNEIKELEQQKEKDLQTEKIKEWLKEQREK